MLRPRGTCNVELVYIHGGLSAEANPWAPPISIKLGCGVSALKPHLDKLMAAKKLVEDAENAMSNVGGEWASRGSVVHACSLKVRTHAHTRVCV